MVHRTGRGLHHCALRPSAIGLRAPPLEDGASVVALKHRIAEGDGGVEAEILLSLNGGHLLKVYLQSLDRQVVPPIWWTSVEALETRDDWGEVDFA